MITTKKQLIEETLEKFRNINTLSLQRNKEGVVVDCIYGRDINGIGCAIGCHVPKEVSEEWDVSGMSVKMIPLQELAPYFDVDAIGMDFLQRVQIIHDVSEGADSFRDRLEELLIELKGTE